MKWIEVCGIRYQKPCILAVTTDPVEELPIFGDLTTIYVANDNVFFHVKILDTLSYDHHRHAYLLKPSITEKCVRHDSLLSFVPLHLRTLPHTNGIFVVPKYKFLL